MSLISLQGKRFLFVGPYPPPYGGVASLLKYLIPSLYQSGASDIAVISFSNTDSIEHYEGFTVYRFNLRAHLIKCLSLSSFPVLLSVLADLRKSTLTYKDIIRECVKAILVNEIAERHNSHIVSFYQSNLSLELLPLSRIWGDSRNIFLTVLGEVYESSSAKFMSDNKLLFARQLNSCKHVIATSEHCARSFNYLEIEKSINVIFVGVETQFLPSEESKNTIKASLSIASDKIVCFFMARMVKEMGLDVLLKIIPLVVQANPHIHFIIAGASGELTDDTLALETLYPENLTALVNVSFQTKKELYCAADILVAPSFNQRACMGVSIKEAMSFKLPVISAQGGGIPEAVIHNLTGLLVPINEDGDVDSQILADYIIELSANTEMRSAFGAAGRKRAEDFFSVSTTNSRLANLYLS